MSILWLFQYFVIKYQRRITMLNGEHSDGPVSDTYLDNVIKQLEISDGSQQTSCVRYVNSSNRKLKIETVLFRSVFVRNDAGTFLRKLDERIKFYDAEIEKLCNVQYQSFVNSFHELLQVRKDTTSMKVILHCSFFLFSSLIR